MASKLFRAVNSGRNGYYHDADGNAVACVNLPGTEIRYEHEGRAISRSTLRRWESRGWIACVNHAAGRYTLTVTGYNAA